MQKKYFPKKPLPVSTVTKPHVNHIHKTERFVFKPESCNLWWKYCAKTINKITTTEILLQQLPGALITLKRNGWLPGKVITELAKMHRPIV
jgi:hypothetical protein